MPEVPIMYSGHAGFNEEEEGESSIKGVQERKLVNDYKSLTEMDSSDSEYQEKSRRPKRKSTNSVNDIDNDSKISEELIAHFDHIFHNLDPEKMWTLKSGRVIEKVIYEYAKNLKYESYIHSFIISNIDKKSPIIDPAFRNSKINLIHEEGMSLASSDIKNNASCDIDQKYLARKEIGLYPIIVVMWIEFLD
ncbi:1620_t:CDS:2 [Gigaspora margarita]|uniref:1620_t:CDS:1 n=1 Tax=Gigaspora margarita TaxID=4874 RepID=A0ABN7VGH2_GIGMA|nr:1620_t:CDS:2 [Gigaspora margarita]